MELNRIVFEEGIDGHSVVIRYPEFSDAPAMQAYINTLSQERTFILFQGKQLTLAEEEEYLKDVIEKVAQGQLVKCLLFVDNILAGIADVDQKSDAIAHQGEYSISIAKAYRGKGYGRLLMNTVLTEAERVLPIRMILLKHFGDNVVARKMYEQFGFTEVGRISGGVLHNDEYVDEVIMVRPVDPAEYATK